MIKPPVPTAASVKIAKLKRTIQVMKLERSSLIRLLETSWMVSSGKRLPARLPSGPRPALRAAFSTRFPR
jgi:hypothetical protein